MTIPVQKRPEPQASHPRGLTQCGWEDAAAGREPEPCERSLGSGPSWPKGEILTPACGSTSAADFHAESGFSVAKTGSRRLPGGLVPSAAAFVGRFYGHVVSDSKSGLPWERGH